MAKLFLLGKVEGFRTLVSKAGKTYGYCIGLSTDVTNAYGQPEKKILDVRYSDKTRDAVENALRDKIGKDVYVEVWASGNEFNGRVRVEYNFQQDSIIIDAAKADPFGQARTPLKAAS